MMKTSILLALLGLAVAKVDYTGYKVFRAHPSLQQLETITHLTEQYDLDVWSEFRHEGDFIDFMVAPNLQPAIERTLQRYSVGYETMIHDVEAAVNAQISPSAKSTENFDFTEYHTLSEITTWMDDFVAEQSSVSLVSAGTSYQGRDIDALKISRGTGSRAFVMTCGIHSREWVSPAACIQMANWYATTDDSTVTTILSTLDIYIVPVSNPDGYLYTWSDDRMWRKTRSSPTDNGCMTNCYGVDPNRNYDAQWSGEGASSSCCNDAFYGPSVFSETESQAQRDLVNSIANVKGYIDIHAYSQLWMYPYGYKTSNCEDNDLLYDIATESVEAIHAVHGKTYEAGSIANVIYVASGSSADYFYDEKGIKCSFAAELRDKGRYGFTLPANQIEPTAEETYAGLNAVAQAIVDGRCD